MIMRDMLSRGSAILQNAGIEEFRLDAWYLLSYCLDISKSQYYMKMNDDVDSDIVCKYDEIIRKRAGHIPLQYITGTQEFMGIDFKVNESVLIPRQDTEVLVSLALNYADGKNILDMCTGSGCIAISIAKLAKPCSVTAVDISINALDVARENADNNNVDVVFVESDLWNNVSGKYDLIVSNPPYITDKEMLTLMPEVGEYEPEIALRGGVNGLDYYRRIIRHAKDFLVPAGMIMFEIGCEQAEGVSELLITNGYRDIKIEKDLAGLDRVVLGVWPG